MLGGAKAFVKKAKAVCIAETADVLLQLTLWSYLGVLTRIYLDRLFNDGCADGWGLCLTSTGGHAKTYGAYFTDLPANMLGCFAMGLLSTASALGLESTKLLAVLPSENPWQHAKNLQVGLRTGYCGSLTTFASWELSLLQLLVGVREGNGGQWQQWLWGYIVGFELAYASLLIGEHAALAVHRWLLREGKQHGTTEMTKLERPTDVPQEGEDLYGIDELNQTLHDDSEGEHASAGHREGDTGLEVTRLNRPTEATEEGEYLYGTHELDEALTQNGKQHACPPQYVLEEPKQIDHTRRFAHQDGGHMAELNENPQPNRIAEQSDILIATSSKTAFCCASFGVLLTCLWIVLAIVDSEHKHAGRRQQWFALLMAPFGCSLRWLLARLNNRNDSNCWPWFPLGTFLANMIACTIDFVIGGLSNRYSLTYWPMVVLPAIRVGYAGSLSTVSTFIAEVRFKLCLRACQHSVSR